ncbi:MAG: hypothetical protein B7Z69_00790 [Actinobacteria bacterium 21-73-9]|nr:MAG: hypothetical protein B7Z69_00790 [Actinobacteria bacterium 21-73-9]
MRPRVVTFFVVAIAVIVLLYAFGGVKRPVASGAASRLTGAASARFTPLSASFPTARRGWVLGTVPCAVRPACVQLRTTRDGGATWTVDALPTALLTLVDQRYHTTIAALNSTGLGVRFANARDGWIYGTIDSFDYYGGITTSRWVVLLWSTHDGGTTWRRLNPPGLASQGPLYDLEVSKSEAYLLGDGPKFTAVLVASPVHRDHWRVVSTPPLPPSTGGSETTGNIVVSGHAGWLVEGGDRGITGSLRLGPGGQWLAWSPPCASVGNSYVVPVASDARHLVVVCEIGGVFAQPSPKAPPGATPGSWWLYSSSDAGTTFHAVRELHGVNGYFSVLASPTPRVMFLQYDRGSGLELVMSRDAGKSAQVVFRGTVTYLHFENASDGIGVVTSRSDTPEMIVTHDGGRSWHVQRFTT